MSLPATSNEKRSLLASGMLLATCHCIAMFLTAFVIVMGTPRLIHSADDGTLWNAAWDVALRWLPWVLVGSILYMTPTMLWLSKRFRAFGLLSVAIPIGWIPALVALFIGWVGAILQLPFGETIWLFFPLSIIGIIVSVVGTALWLAISRAGQLRRGGLERRR